MIPLAPDESSRTVSLVDMQPSESIRSKVTRVAARRAASRVGAPTTASVVSTTSIVASPGASIPAPLAIPPTVHPCRCGKAAIFATESVVMIASAASEPPSADNALQAASTPLSSAVMGSRSPMSPVEQTATSIGATPRSSATCSAVRCVSANPAGPVQALAPPELRTTARNRPSSAHCAVHRTGAALTRLVVNTAAASWRGPSLTTRATSAFPEDLRPAATPAARNPPAAVTPLL